MKSSIITQSQERLLNHRALQLHKQVCVDKMIETQLMCQGDRASKMTSKVNIEWTLCIDITDIELTLI